MKKIIIILFFFMMCGILSSCDRNDFTLSLVMGGVGRSGFVYRVENNVLSLVKCDLNTDFSIGFIDKNYPIKKLTSKEIRTINKYLKKIEKLEKNVDRSKGTIKDGEHVVLDYKQKRYEADYHLAELGWDKYGETYYILNEFGDYMLTLTPEHTGEYIEKIERLKQVYG